MKLSTAIQEALVAILTLSAENKHARFVQALLKPEIYDPYYSDIVEEADRYIQKYGEPPREHLLDIINVLSARNPRSESIYRRIYDSLQLTIQGVNAEYVFSQASAFARKQRLQESISAALDELEKDSPEGVDVAENILRDSAAASLDLFNPGGFLDDPNSSLRFLDEDEDEVFSTGIPQFDKYSMGPMRRGLHVFVAPPNRGKSWWLIHLGKHAIVRGARVLHITLEMPEKQVLQRYVQNFFSVSKRGGTKEYLGLETDSLGRFVTFDERTLDDRPAFSDEGIRSLLCDRLKRLKHMPRLLVKEFPTSQLTVRQLTGYLDSLEGIASFMPDLILVDYADLMYTDADNYRRTVGLIYEQLRGVAMERNVAIATASQANRGSLSKQVVTEASIAEDFSKVMTADTVITYSQTEAEKRLGLARLFIAKHRGDLARIMVIISQCYELGQFVMDSALMGKLYIDSVNDRAEEGDSKEEDEEGGDLEGGGRGFSKPKTRRLSKG